MPITWKNVTGFNTASQAAVGAELFKQSREALSDGIGGIQNILKQHQDQTQDAWKQGKENNTNAYLDRLAQAKTPEELAALQASGELQAMKQKWGAQFDSAGVRDYEAGLQQKLIERITAQNQYADDSRLRGERGIREEALGKLHRGDAEGFWADLAKHDLLNESELSKEGYIFQKDARAEKREDTRLAYEGDRVQLAKNEDGRAGELHGLKVQDYWDLKNSSLAAQQAVVEAGSAEQARANLAQQLRDGNIKLPEYESALKGLSSLETEASKLTAKQQSSVDKLTLDEMAKETGDYYGAWRTIGAQLGATTDAEVQELIKTHGGGKLSNFKDYMSRQSKENSSLITKHKGATEGTAYQTLFKETPNEKNDTANNVRRAIMEFKQDGGNAVPKGMDFGPVLAEVAQRYGVDDEDWWNDQIESGEFKNILAEVYGEYNYQKGLQDKALMAEKLVDSYTAGKQAQIGAQNLKNLYR